MENGGSALIRGKKVYDPDITQDLASACSSSRRAGEDGGGEERVARKRGSWGEREGNGEETRRTRYFYRILRRGWREPLRNLGVPEGAKGGARKDRKKVIRAALWATGAPPSSVVFVAPGTRSTGYYLKPS